MKRSLVVAALMVGPAAAGSDPTVARIEKALPAGWTLLATDTELVLRHDRPCYVVGDKAASENGPLVTLELRYKLEPKWSAKQLADAHAADDKIATEVRALRAKYRIDEIRVANGQPQPTTPDERARLASYAKAEGHVRARLVKIPLCTLGASSLFDDGAYQQLSMKLDPPEAMTEALRVVELVKHECGAS